MIIHYMSNAGACNKSEKTKGMQICWRYVYDYAYDLIRYCINTDRGFLKQTQGFCGGLTAFIT